MNNKKGDRTLKSVIYETKGRAKEFNELAINLFTGCGHQCIYCYGADVTHQSKEDFNYKPRPRVTASDIERSASRWAGDPRRILMCFVTDPYQPIEQETQITRTAIQILHKHNLNVVLLTKGGDRSLRDLDLLTPKDAYATTLTLLNDRESKIWEPHAAPPIERAMALKEAHKLGIETWVSFEPVISPQQTFNLFRLTKDFTGHYKVGTMNYFQFGRKIDWRGFGWDIKKLMDEHHAKYYFKKDLLREMQVAPEYFNQTWVCR